jgi:hypothetical protein
MKIFRLAAILTALVLSGCASGYQQFYRPASADWKVVRSTDEPVVSRSSGRPQEDVGTMFEAGYGLVGTAAFVGALQDRAGAVAQAKKVGANRVVIGNTYRNTQSGVTPITTPTTTTAYTSGSVRPYGGGYGASYSGMTTIYGSETTYIPYSVDQYEQYALFFAPLQRKGLGLMVYMPTDEAKRLAGTNKGHQVTHVRRDSPAYRADILPGDLLVTFGGRDLIEPKDFITAVTASYGRDIDVVMYRGSVRIVKHLFLPGPDQTW